MPSDNNSSCSSSSAAGTTSAEQQTETSVFSLRSKTSVNIIDCIRKRDWVTFCELIATPSGIEKVRRKTDKTKMTVLGMVLGCRAPYDVIEKVIDIHPAFVIKPDKLNALPIHIACLNGTTVQILQLLLERGGMGTLRHSDSDGRVPLHHAVEFATTRRLRGELAVDEEEVFAVVEFLCNVAAETLRYDDGKGKYPMCLAHILMDAAHRIMDMNRAQRINRVISLLRKSNIELHKIQQAQREGNFKYSPYEVNTAPTDTISSSTGV